MNWIELWAKLQVISFIVGIIVLAIILIVMFIDGRKK